VTKKEVPDQKASIAVPLSFSVIIGSAILREVASRAAARVTIHIDAKARRNPLDGWNKGFTSSSGVRLGDTLPSDRLALSVEGCDTSNFSWLK